MNEDKQEPVEAKWSDPELEELERDPGWVPIILLLLLVLLLIGGVLFTVLSGV